MPKAVVEKRRATYCIQSAIMGIDIQPVSKPVLL